MANNLRPSKAPNLLVAPTSYAQQYQDQLNNALRLYFNQVDNFLAATGGSLGGVYFDFPHVAASSENSQYAPNNTPTIVVWDFVESQNGFVFTPSLTATALLSGIYTIIYSLQFVNTDNVQNSVTVWMRVNGIDVERSATIFTVPPRKSAGVNGYICGFSEATFTLNAGDEIGLYWATSNAYNPVGPVDGVYMEYIPPQTSPFPAPSSPSAIGSITFTSRLPG